jgi:hypothetical protein
MKTIPDNQKLFDLINDARTGKLVLPQFQRNFVWSRDEITSLLVSILQGHFIGSFLLLNCDKENVPFAIRTLEGIKLADNQLKPDAMILDGQQRLTSLHYVFAAPNIPLRWTKYPYRFYLNLHKVTEGDLENAVLSERCQNGQMSFMETHPQQFESLFVPFTEVENWNDWLNSYERWLVEKDKDVYFNQYFKVDKPSWVQMMERLRTFLVPTISIPKFHEDDPDSLGEVCAIFEKINSTGVKLSVYDLLTARLYKYRIDLHTLWEQTVDDHHLVDVYSEGIPDEFGIYILRIIALLRGLDVKSKTLIKLKPDNFIRDWKVSAKFAEKALERMTTVDEDGFGAFDRKWMPYLTMVSPLAAMLAFIESQNLGHQSYKMIKKWYWSSVFRERFAGSVESLIYRDFQDFIKTESQPDFIMEAVHDGEMNIVDNTAFSLKDVSRLNSLYRGIICLIALRGAKDFTVDDSIKFHTLEDHHIFPFAYLRGIFEDGKKKYTLDQINCVINRTLIADQTNRKIQDKKPSQYISELIPSGRAAEILLTHYIGDLPLSAMQENNYDSFLNEREKMLIAEIRCRITDANR